MSAKRLTKDDLLAIREKVAAERVLRPEGKIARVTVHMGTCGLASGAGKVLDALNAALAETGRGDVVVTTSGCIGFCSQEPLVTVERAGMDPVVYREVSPDAMRLIFHEHVLGGKAQSADALARGLAVNETPLEPASGENAIRRIQDLPYLALQKSIVLRNRGIIDPEKIEEFIWRGGYAAVAKALTELSPTDIVQQVKTSGLRGRGGGGFPTGLKWQFCAASKSDVKYVLCNADEGDPGAFMDRSVMEGDPHAVLEGMIVAAKAIGANQGYIYCRAEYPLAVRRLNLAIAQAREHGLLGKNILGTGFDFDIEVYQGAGAFVCGEETALMASIEGRRGTPRPRPPFPAVSGLWKKPTILNNVETYANIGPIIVNGGEAYAAMGTEGSKGTKVFALTGKVNNVGLVEVPMGMSLGDIIFDIGGGIPKDKEFKAVQLGGPSGGCIPAEHLNTQTDYEAIAKVGAIMGSGGMIVVDEDTCMVDMARFFMDFCQDESCGKCTPCRVGTRRMLEILERICHGEGQEGDIELLESLANTVRDSALCGLGQTAPNPILSTIRYFRDEYVAHIRDKRCPAVVCSALFKSPCQHTCPVGMDVPAYVSLVAAQRFDDALSVLHETNPLSAVCGRVCGHKCQSKCRRGQLDESVAIMHLKRFVTDNAKRPRVSPIPVTQPERVAIVGAGPSGLTAAWELKKRGYAVTLFEALPKAGGMLRYGIPAYRLPREALDRDIQDILDSGVELRTNVRLGRDMTLEGLKREYDIVYLAVGAHKSLKLGIAGEDANGVVGAVEFLRQVNGGERVKVGRRVAVIGGGNSAIDAARSAIRAGAEDVTIYYRRERKDMPAMAAEIEAALHEGIKLECLVAPLRVIVENGQAKQLELGRMALGNFDRSARRRPSVRPGTEFTVAVDTIVAAIGQAAELDFVTADCGVTASASGLKADRHGRTAREGVWAGGDAVTGPAMAIDAIRAGRDAAHDIDTQLRAAHGQPAWQAPARKFTIPEAPKEPGEGAVQTPMPELPVGQRRGSFSEVELGYNVDLAVAEARRCLRCDAGK